MNTQETTASNKLLMQAAMAGLAQGNGKDFVALMADDFRWVMHGSGPWAGTYEGKQDVLNRLMKPLFAQFATQYRNEAEAIIAEGDRVVVQCRGNVKTKAGKDYNNTYCYVCRMQDGKMTELVEYMDTALVDEALEAPAS